MLLTKCPKTSQEQTEILSITPPNKHIGELKTHAGIGHRIKVSSSSWNHLALSSNGEQRLKLDYNNQNQQQK